MPHQCVCASRRDQVGTSLQCPSQFCYLYIIYLNMDFYGYVYSVYVASRPWWPRPSPARRLPEQPRGAGHARPGAQLGDVPIRARPGPRGAPQ